jgi:hypothetical protein
MRHPLIASLVPSAACVAYTSAQSEPAPSPPSQDFATMKTTHLARPQQEIACVQAAANLDALRACRPQPPGGHAGPPPAQ